MRKIFIFRVEIPYEKINIEKAQLFSKKVIRLKFLFKEVKFKC